MDIEVMICTHNRSSLLQRVVRSILSAELPAGVQVGIFVVANGCSDDTGEVLRYWEDNPKYFGNVSFRWRAVDELGKSVALNQSLGELSAPVVAFVDDDHRIDHLYLKAVHEATQKYSDINLFCGRILPDWDSREPRWVHEKGGYRIYPLPIPRYDLGNSTAILGPMESTPGGGNLFLRTPLINKIGKFKTDLGPVGHNLGGAEDIEWVQRAVALGENIRYVPEATQFHFVDSQRLTVRYLMNKAFERTSSTIRVRPFGDNLAATIPMYTLRKSMSYALKALFSVTSSRRRYFLVRTAAALGELDGFRRRRKESRSVSS